MKLSQLIACQMFTVDNANMATEQSRANYSRAVETINKLCEDHMPSGSGFDNGTRLDFDESTPSKLVFHTDFHHMDEHGGYSHWSSWEVTVEASLAFGITVETMSLDDESDPEDGAYVSSAFHEALMKEIR